MFKTLAETLPIPPLSDGARGLLGLDEEQREDPRTLALMANREPVQLARLLSLARSPYVGASRVPMTADDSITLIGVRASYTAMVHIAMLQEFQGDLVEDSERNFMLRHAMNLSLAARRVANLLKLGPEESGDLMLAALFDALGVHGAMASTTSTGGQVRAHIADLARENNHNFRDDPVLAGFWTFTAKIAERWDAPAAVAELLAHSGPAEVASSAPTDAGLLLLCERAVSARARRENLSVDKLEVPLLDEYADRLTGLTSFDLVI